MIYLDEKNYLQDSFEVYKGHIKCTIEQKEAHLPQFLTLIFD